MTIDSQKVKMALLKGSYIDEKDLARVEARAAALRRPLADCLLEEGVVTRVLLGQALAESFGVPFADFGARGASHELVTMVPEEVARRFRMVLFRIEEKSAVVATDDPSQPEILGAAQTALSDKEISFAYALPDDIDDALVHYQKTLETKFSAIIAQNKRVAPEIIDAVLDDAIAHRASDVHFEPQKSAVAVRFRVDGVLREAGRIPKEFYENIVNRVRVESRLRIDEHFSAQDGSMRIVRGNDSIDLRVSIVPTLEGEKVAIRILSRYVGALGMSDLGLSAGDREIVEKAARKPFGMILVAGPTGSGKTTTLYALLRILHRPEVNITTIEDPVEYRMEEINQIQVNLQTNLTFAQGLRSIVRQDPDVILVGEIRDRETAEIAVNAALTGHLLLSTFHANDAATAIPRLLEMGVEPFLLASTLELVVAQRLVRRICGQCRASVSVSRNDIVKLVGEHSVLFENDPATLYRGQGCAACGGSGYRGRVALFEAIPFSPKLKEQILRTPSAREIWKVANESGARAMFLDGIEKAKNGITTIEEVLRVANPPEK